MMTPPRARYRMNALALFVFGMLLAIPARSLPIFGESVDMAQPDGSTVVVRVWGDEYYQRLEDTGGFTLVRDPDSGWLCFARLDADRENYVSTGIVAGLLPPADLAPGLRLPGSVVATRVVAAQRAAGRVPGDGEKIEFPLPADSGEVRGIALLVDFSDEPAVMDPADIEAYFNEVGYTGFGNNGSVRDYYRDISGGRLDLTHEVTPYYYRAAHPKFYYEAPSESPGWRARQLVTEALSFLDRRDFDFSEYDANGDGYVDLVSCLYAGTPALAHGLGLWPQAGEAGFHADGVIARLWQISPLGDQLRLGTVCHEIGHALCQWPDLYDLGFESWGAGLYCLMSNPATNTNPLEVCGPLKYRSGWTENLLLDGVMPAQAAVAGANQVFVVPHPEVDNELYILENRQRTGRDLALPDEGLAVWHVDWRGSNNREAQTADFHYMVTLVQADGRWDLENDANWGDDTDLFGGDEFDDFGPNTVPPARWWRGQDANLNLDAISLPGPVMTFDFRDGIGRWPVQLIAEPQELDPRWRITGADGYLKFGAGTRLVHVPEEGSYLVTWRRVPGWQAPPTEAVWVPEAGPVPEVRGIYSHPPFAETSVPALSTAAPGRGGQLLDLDADGDLDLYLCREGAADVLLRNDGGWQFTDVTPPLLAAPAATVAAAWADIDSDGDQDVYLVRRGGADLLLRQSTPGVFSDTAEYILSDPDSVRGATWVDHDGDGRLDLYLVRDGVADLILRSPSKSGPMLSEYEFRDILPGLSFARTVSGAWCDYDADGRPDLYMVNEFGANLLAGNRLPARFVNVTHGGLGLPWRGGSVAWGDHDGDGDFDLYLAHEGAADVLFTQYGGTFVMESEPNTDTPGFGRDVVWADFDNDGDLDLYLARFNQPDRLLLNDGDDVWSEALLLLDVVAGPTVAVLAGDLDGDGGVDLALDRDGEPAVILRNTLSRGNWLQVDLRGRDFRRDPVGAVLSLHAGEQLVLRQVAARSGPSSPPRRTHFGLGAATVADSLVVIWPDGSRQVVLDITANQVVEVVQPSPGGTGAAELPTVTRLWPAWPNPFNAGTRIEFDLARPGPVELVVYDVAGRRVRVFQQGELPVGKHGFRWDGRDQTGRQVAAGVYLARLVADGQQQTIRMALVK